MDEDRHYSGAPRYASLRDYLRVLRERWVLIALSTLVVGGAAFAYTATQQKTYEAQSTLSPRQRSADIGLIGSSAGPPVSPQSLTAELAARAERDSIAKQVQQSVDTELSVAQVAAKVSASIDAQTNLVQLIATDSDPEFAAELANAYSDAVQKEALDSEREQIAEAIAARQAAAEGREVKRRRPALRRGRDPRGAPQPPRDPEGDRQPGRGRERRDRSLRRRSRRSPRATPRWGSSPGSSSGSSSPSRATRSTRA